MMRVAAFISFWLALVIAWPLGAEAELPAKQLVAPVPNQDGVKKTPAPTVPGIAPGREKSRIRERAVTSDDYKPLAGSTPGVRVHRVTQPPPTTGGTEKESATPASRRIPSTLRHKDRIVTEKKKSPDDK